MDLKGSITALITPFRNGAVDEQGFRELIEWQIAEGTNGLVPVGTTGESPTSSADEHKRVIEICGRDRGRPRPGDGRHRLELHRRSDRVHPPRGPCRRRCRARASCPITTSPRRRGFTATSGRSPRQPTSRSSSTMFRAVPSPISRSRPSTGSPGRRRHHWHQGRHRRPHPPFAPAPDDRHGVHPALRRGCHRPRLHRPWRRRLHLGDRQCRAAAVRRSSRRPAATAIRRRALTLQDRLMPLHQALFVETSPAPVKYAASVLGLAATRVRLPMVPATEGRPAPPSARRWFTPASMS